MDCRAFQRNHLGFIDDTLPGVELVGMQRHLMECRGCAAHDALVRRSLLAARNLPRISPSPDFAARLEVRLAEARRRPAERTSRGPGAGIFAAAAAGVIAMGYIGAATLEWVDPPRHLAFSPVVASQPAVRIAPIALPTIFASAYAGMPVWPAALLAEQAPVHFVTAEFRPESWSR